MKVVPKVLPPLLCQRPSISGLPEQGEGSARETGQEPEAESWALFHGWESYSGKAWWILLFKVWKMDQLMFIAYAGTINSFN